MRESGGSAQGLGRGGAARVFRCALWALAFGLAEEPARAEPPPLTPAPANANANASANGDVSAPATGPWTRVRLAELGMGEYVPRKWQGVAVTLAYRVPADRVVTEARIRIPLAQPRRDAENILSVSVLVNGASVAKLAVGESPPGTAAKEIAVDPRLFGIDNDITLLLGLARPATVDPACYPPGSWAPRPDDAAEPGGGAGGGDLCPCVQPGAWTIIGESAELAVRTTRVPRVADLDAFRAHFVTENAGRVPVVFAVSPSLAMLRAAFLYAAHLGRGDERPGPSRRQDAEATQGAESLLGRAQRDVEEPVRSNLRTARFERPADAPPPLRFPVSIGALPDETAVVLALSSDLARLGLPAADGATIRLLTHPHAASASLLVLSAPDPEALTRLVTTFFDGAGDGRPLVDQSVAESAGPNAKGSGAQGGSIDAHGRLLPGSLVRFADLPGHGALIIRGHNDGVMRLAFDLGPGLFFWPTGGVPVTLLVDAVVSGGGQPKLVLTLNGRFVSVLHPRPRLRASGPVELRFALPQALLRGHNELRIDVELPAASAGCPVSAPGDHTSIDGNSTIDLRPAVEYVRLPDLGRFTWQGYPYTRAPDLGETTIVLPDALQAGSIGAVLAVAAHVARAAGTLPTGARFARASELPPILDRDLIVVGTELGQPLVHRFSSASPASVERARLLYEGPSILEEVMGRVAGRRIDVELADARRWIEAEGSRAGLITSFESPLHPGRTVTMLTGASDAALPNVMAAAASTGGGQAAAGGTAESETDVLVTDGGEAHAFRLGRRSYTVGRLGSAREWMWILSQNSLVLLPFILIAALLISLVTTAWSAAHARRRLMD